MTRVNMGKQDIQGYTGYTWVKRIHRGMHGIQRKEKCTGYTV